jgi:DNA-binding transcriptional LysR family regulator
MPRAAPDDHPSWDDLRCVLAIARGGSLGAAAQQLGLNHSSVYRRLDALEARLRVRLFERARTSYRLTIEGELMAEAAQRMEAEALAAHRRVLGRDLRLSGTIRVSTTDMLGLHLLPPLLREFPQRYPEIEIELSINNRLIDLTRRDADVAIRAADQAPDHLVGRRICKTASAAYAERAYLKRAGRQRALADHEWLALDDSMAHAPQARWLREQVPQARCHCRFDSLEALLQGVRAGLGAGVLPCFVGDADSGLTRLTPPAFAGEFGIWVLTHPDLRRSARIRAFVNEIGALIAGRERQLLGA